jgi:hypothetical protein
MRTHAAPTVWIPGRGPDAAALTRLRAAFPRPRAPMGEAWFLGQQRRMYPELMGDLTALSAEDLEDPLVEIATGTSNFGGEADCWGAWFHYLIAPLLPRALEGGFDSVAELLVTGLVAHYPQGIDDPPYRDFRQDMLLTLGRCVTGAQPWLEGRGARFRSWYDRGRSDNPGWLEARGEFAASAFLHAKYLAPDAIPAWTTSMLDFDAPAWRAQVLIWLVAMKPMFEGAVAQLSEMARVDGASASWAWSHVLKGTNDGDYSPDRPTPPPALPEANRAALVATVRRRMNHERLCAWLDSFKAIPALDQGLYDVPERFTRYYLD